MRIHKIYSEKLNIICLIVVRHGNIVVLRKIFFEFEAKQKRDKEKETDKSRENLNFSVI